MAKCFTTKIVKIDRLHFLRLSFFFFMNKLRFGISLDFPTVHRASLDSSHPTSDNVAISYSQGTLAKTRKLTLVC
jgi:hypothetical protein